MNDSSLPNFEGKVLMVLLRNRDTEITNIIRNARLETQGDRLFLVGTVAGHPENQGPLDDLSNGIAWEEVSEYLVFDSIQDVVARIGGSPRKKKWF